MPIDNKHIKKHFEKSMKDYDKNAVVQDLTAQKIVQKLSDISKSFDNILELGAGTGLLTKHIAAALEFKNYYANDLVEKSKTYVEKFVPAVNFIAGNALKIKLARKADLIVSNAMFQWFENLEKAVDLLKINLAEGGIFAFSTFSPENFKEIKDLTGLSLEYRTEEEIKKILAKDFEILYSETFVQELNFQSPLEVLAHMKKTGVNSLSEKTWTVKKVKDFCDKYSERYLQPKLTYSPVILIARKRRGQCSQGL